MKERPILFNGAMVRAIREGRKTVTRRALKVQPHIDGSGNFCVGNSNYGQDLDGRPVTKHFAKQHCPYGKPGDRLWVRETWFCDHFEVMSGPYRQPADLDLAAAREDGTLVYAADDLTPYEAEQPVWKPSIHMPRWACRLLLEITAVRVERLQDITAAQAEAEGVDAAMCRRYLETSPSRHECKAAAIHGFAGLWADTGGDWASNPWVWVVEFQRVPSEALAAGAAA